MSFMFCILQILAFVCGVCVSSNTKQQMVGRDTPGFPTGSPRGSLAIHHALPDSTCCWITAQPTSVWVQSCYSWEIRWSKLKNPRWVSFSNQCPVRVTCNLSVLSNKMVQNQHFFRVNIINLLFSFLKKPYFKKGNIWAPKLFDQRM